MYQVPRLLTDSELVDIGKEERETAYQWPSAQSLAKVKIKWVDQLAFGEMTWNYDPTLASWQSHEAFPEPRSPRDHFRSIRSRLRRHSINCPSRQNRPPNKKMGQKMRRNWEAGELNWNDVKGHSMILFFRDKRKTLAPLFLLPFLFFGFPATGLPSGSRYFSRHFEARADLSIT